MFISTFISIFILILIYIFIFTLRFIFFVNLYFNDQDLGVYALEEAFSKDLLIRQNKKNGPIFSLKDELGEKFPNVFFELYSKNFWLEKDAELVNELFIILNNIRNKKEIYDHKTK